MSGLVWLANVCRCLGGDMILLDISMLRIDVEEELWLTLCVVGVDDCCGRKPSYYNARCFCHDGCDLG